MPSDHRPQVRKDYAADMKSSDVARQQKGVTVYLIDRLALRVGGEKDTDEEADTVRRRVSRGWPVGRGKSRVASRTRWADTEGRCSLLTIY